ncbi:hypothetical protein [Lonomia obliqua multiple nucleopolyhedrovirus]|uniref:Uncharacterized protein n=1 Tax=Lonomia obliqua multiple nucleopolyhedrovirus TaxID=134394 RepID=A0A126FCC3_9ABAC|nr:hypothetical protein [Lonomia obliqua multiple nucleopolyhedrovirus]AKN81051.1 hypothetical protein [Lonomia obliqua multiple nucleopolyhedrovirus]
MGHYYNVSRFTLFCCNTNNTFSFDAIQRLLRDSNYFENDDNMSQTEPELLTPVYNLCHEELFALMWNAKYAKSTFLPEYWAPLYYKSKNNECRECNSDGNNPHLNATTAVTLWCGCEKFQYYTSDDLETLCDIVLDLNNYCIVCKNALFNIINVEFDENFKCFNC